MENRKLLHVFVDGEFGEREALELERHLADCEACRLEVERISALKARTREALKPSRTPAPEALRAKLTAATAAPRRERSLWRRLALPGLAAAVASAALTFALLPSASPLIEASVERHESDLPVEIPGPSPDRVSHWFRGKVRFPVRVPRFSDGTNLLGGRLSPVREHMAAHLTYERRGHKITILAFDPDRVSLPQLPLSPSRVRVQDRDVYLSTAHGYQIAVFQDRGVGYAITADLDNEDITNIVAAGWAQ